MLGRMVLLPSTQYIVIEIGLAVEPSGDGVVLQQLAGLFLALLLECARSRILLGVVLVEAFSQGTISQGAHKDSAFNFIKGKAEREACCLL